ncbi:MAG: alpha/beta hydrolase [Bacteroidota bacterium]|jgi:pimeloyl-ACP methyl ester carboxylesterase|nr:alpha/beta hydrolase [Bacteroidota bacterium]
MKYAEFKKIKVAYSDAGKGRVIVLLHGFLGSHEVWSEFSKKLSKRFRVIAIDLPGHGKTPSIGYYHSTELLAQSVKAVLDSVGVRRYVIAGHSMGGYAALAFAELFPENVSGISLFNSTSYADSEEKKKERDKVIRLVKKEHRHYVGEVVTSLFAPNNLPKLKEEVNKVKRIAQEISKQSIINSLEGMKERKSRDLILKFAEYPVLFVIGKKDSVINFETMYPQMGLCKYPSVLMVEEGGHMCFYEEPVESLKALSSFADRCFRKNY